MISQKLKCLFLGHINWETEFRFLDDGRIEYWAVCLRCHQPMEPKYYIAKGDHYYSSFKTITGGRLPKYHDWKEVK